MRRTLCLVLFLMIGISLGVVSEKAEAVCPNYAVYAVTITSTSQATANTLYDCWGICAPGSLYSDFFGSFTLEMGQLNKSLNRWGAISDTGIMFYGTMNLPEPKKIVGEGVDIYGTAYMFEGFYSPEGCYFQRERIK